MLNFYIWCSFLFPNSTNDLFQKHRRSWFMVINKKKNTLELGFPNMIYIGKCTYLPYQFYVNVIKLYWFFSYMYAKLGFFLHALKFLHLREGVAEGLLNTIFMDSLLLQTKLPLIWYWLLMWMKNVRHHLCKGNKRLYCWFIIIYF